MREALVKLVAEEVHAGGVDDLKGHGQAHFRSLRDNLPILLKLLLLVRNVFILGFVIIVLQCGVALIEDGSSNRCFILQVQWQRCYSKEASFVGFLDVSLRLNQSPWRLDHSHLEVFGEGNGAESKEVGDGVLDEDYVVI